MTDSEGTGGAKDNVRDDLNKAAGKGKKDATTDAVEQEESTGGGGSGTKDNVSDELRESQDR